MSEVFAYFLDDYGSLLTEVVNYYVGVFVAGVIAAFIAWAIGYTVYSVYRWLNDTTKDR